MGEALSMIAHMRGPDFLVLYLWSSVIAFVCCWLAIKYVYRSSLGPALVLPKEVDPYYCAFLRDGEEEVARLALFELQQKGFLELKVGTIMRVEKMTAAGSETPELSSIAKAMLPLWGQPNQMKKTKELKKFLADPVVKKELSALCSSFQKKAARDKLIFPDKLSITSALIVAAGVLFVVALAMFKLVAAFLSYHRNIEALVIMMFIAVLAILLLLTRRQRLTRQGARYLNRIQSPFCGSMGKLDSQENIDKTMMVGLFGFSLLAGTSLALLMPYLKSQSFWAYDNSRGSSSGCSGCSGGCSGCGGGCGGCGG